LHLHGRQVIPDTLRTNADNRLSPDPLGPVEGSNGIVKSSHIADVRAQPAIPDPPDKLTQLGTNGFHDEVDSEPARGPRIGWARDGHQRPSGANHARRPLHNIATQDIENQIDFAHVFQGVVIEVAHGGTLRPVTKLRKLFGSASTERAVGEIEN
jgi:hypothetical protein